MKHGKGIFYYKTGAISRYEGEFENDRYNGQGKLVLKNGGYHIGQFNYSFSSNFSNHAGIEGIINIRNCS